jgi:RimJ/RimL family protein N-acetyltransferase
MAKPLTPRLATHRLDLVALKPDDAIEMVSVLADPALYEFIGNGPKSLGELEGTYRRWAEGSPTAGETWHNWLIRLRDDGAAMGHMQATVMDDGAAAAVGWIIGTAFQHRGYAIEATRAVVAWLVAQGVDTITANVHPGHVASARVAAKAGLAPSEEVIDGEIVWRSAVRPASVPR